MSKAITNHIFRIGISVLFLVLLFTRIDTNILIDSVKSIDIRFFTLAIILFVLFLFIWVLRWQLFLSDINIEVRFFAILKTLLIGFTLALFLPSTLGTDVGRTFDMARTHDQKIAIVSTVFMDRLIGLLAVVIMSLIAIAIMGYQYVNESIIVVIILATLAFGSGWVLFFNKRFMKKFHWVLQLPVIHRFEESLYELYATIYDMQRKRRLFMATFFISMVMQTFEILAVLMMAYAINIEINPIFFFVFMPIIWIILIIPISIGGLGLREAVFVFFFTQVGMRSTDAVTVSLLYYMLYAITGVVGGIFPLIAFINKKLFSL